MLNHSKLSLFFVFVGAVIGTTLGEMFLSDGFR